MFVAAMLENIYMSIINGADSRAKKLPGISSCNPVIYILLSYALISYVLYKWMSKRESFHLRYLIICYDVVVATLSSYIVTQIILSVIRQNPNWICRKMPDKGTFDVDDMRVANFCYWAFICKVIELMDTAFYILRKKDKQLKAINYYHHIMNVVGSWAIARYYPGAPVGIILHFFNSLTHSVLYLNHVSLLLGFHFVHRNGWKYFLLTMARVQYTSFILPSAISFYIGCPENYIINSFLAGGMVSLMIFHLFHIVKDQSISKLSDLKDWSTKTMFSEYQT